MKTKDLLLYAAIGVVVFFAFKALMKFLKGIKNEGQNLLASTPLGWFGSIRSAEGQAAANEVINMKFLTNTAYLKAEPKYNTAKYSINYLGTDLSNSLAQHIIEANSNVPGGFLDDSAAATEALLNIKNQAQALEVAHSYSLDKRTKGKQLNRGIQWLTDGDMIIVANHFKNLPTGVTDKASGQELNKLDL